jgi:hypothetical protein
MAETPSDYFASLAIAQVGKLRDESHNPEASTETINHLRRILRVR